MSTNVCPQPVHDALKADDRAWDAQPRLANDILTEGAVAGTFMEWRNCGTCHSTLARVVTAAEAGKRAA